MERDKTEMRLQSKTKKNAAKWNYSDWNEIKRKRMRKQNDAHREMNNKNQYGNMENKLKNHNFALSAIHIQCHTDSHTVIVKRSFGCSGLAES